MQKQSNSVIPIIIVVIIVAFACGLGSTAVLSTRPINIEPRAFSPDLETVVNGDDNQVITVWGDDNTVVPDAAATNDDAMAHRFAMATWFIGLVILAFVGFVYFAFGSGE